MTLHAIVAALGGDLYQGGLRANVPAPGHSADDRSVSLLHADGRVIIHGFGAADWREVRDVGLVVFEGWCLGTPPEPAAALAEPVNALERDEDRDCRWRRWCNDALARDYPALWQRIDQLLFLQPPGFDVVPTWRWQQEQSMQAHDPRRRGMARAQLDRFVQHYERVSRQALRTLPAIADTVVRLDAARRPID